MPRRYRNYNRVVGVGCIGLLLVMFLLINPFAGLSVSALAEIDSDGLELYATAASTVEIGFTPTSGTTSVTPIDTTGTKARIDVQARVRVQNSDGYKVYVHGDSSQLTNGSYAINSVSSPTTYGNMNTVNTWGYAAMYKETETDKTIPDNTTYSAIPTARGAAFYNRTGTGIKDEVSYYMLSFAANIGSNMPAGTYSNQVTMSVISSPLEVTGLSSITNMQEMTSDICAASTTGDEKQLKDVRDGKFYWVGKLADGKCWMTQNLALDLATNPSATGGTVKTFTNADTDLNSKDSWTPSSGTYTTVTADTILASAGQRSWNLGSYYINNPSGTTSCGEKRSSLANCTSYFTALDTPTTADNDTNAHYLTSHYYQWCAATAGCSATSDQSSDSICPKGWRLPMTIDGHNEFWTLVSTYGIPSGSGGSSNTTGLVSSPLYFVAGGYVSQTSYLFSYAGRYGAYLSSSATNTSSTNSYPLSFMNTDTIYPTDINFNRQYGISVRCIAR